MKKYFVSIISLFIVTVIFPSTVFAAETNCVVDSIVSGDQLIVNDRCEGIIIYSIQEDGSLDELSTYQIDEEQDYAGPEGIETTDITSARSITVNGDTIYFGSLYSFYALDISDPTNPTRVSETELDLNYYYRRWGAAVQDLFFNNNYLYLALNTGGVKLYDTTDTLTGDHYFSDISGVPVPNTVYASENYLYTIARSELLNSDRNVVQVFDTTNKEEIELIHTIDDVYSNTASSVFAENNQLYIRSEDALTIYDVDQGTTPTRTFNVDGNGFLTQISDNSFYTRGTENEIYTITISDDDELETTVQTVDYIPSGIQIKDDLVFVKSFRSGVFVYDVTDQSNWELIASYDTNDTSNDNQDEDLPEEDDSTVDDIDETVTPEEQALITRYRYVSDAPKKRVRRKHNITGVSSKKNGKIQIAYKNKKKKTVQVFPNVQQKPHVQFFHKSARVIVFHPNGKKIAVVNAKNGKIQSRKRIANDFSYKGARIQVKDVRGGSRPEIVVTSVARSNETAIFSLKKKKWKLIPR